MIVAEPAAPAANRPPLLSRLAARTARVGVVGLGYVGLPLALTFSRKAGLRHPRPRRGPATRLDALARRTELPQAHRRADSRRGGRGPAGSRRPPTSPAPRRATRS